MPKIGCDGIQQKEVSTDMSIISTKDIIAKLGDAAGATMFKITDSSDASCVEIDSAKNLKVNGNLYVHGTQFVSNTEEVMIGDRAITMNAEITHSGQNTYGGMLVKSVSNAVGEILVASQFTSGSGAITIAGGPGTLLAGDLIYVNGTKNNDGLYKVTSADATSIVINALATEYDVRTALVTETVVANISEATPAYLVYDGGWKIGSYVIGAVADTMSIIGFSSIEAVDYTATHTNIGAKGLTNDTFSGASKVGIHSTGLAEYTGVPENVQEFAQETNDILEDIVDTGDGAYMKSGSSALGNGVGSLAVVFVTPFATAITTVICTVQNLIDAAPLHFTTEITVSAITGFTVVLSGLTDSVNYSINWIATGN